MNILITGGTGLIGRALCQHLQQQGHCISVLSRRPDQVAALCSGATGVGSLAQLNGQPPFDAVINLAGAPIVDRHWSNTRRQQLRDSRIRLTDTLVQWMQQQDIAPATLISASAIGWYGDCSDALLDEHSPPGGNDFASQLCQDWETAARQAETNSRVVLLRIAPVLAAEGGLLARMRLPFRLGLGGRLGSGHQWMPWIHLHDLLRLIVHLLHNSQCSGVYNACAPLPASNAEFTRCLARAVGRPALLPVPAWLLKGLLGERSVLLLGSQNLRPLRTAQSGFSWQYSDLQLALTACLQR